MTQEQEKWEEELREQRMNEQEEKNDYAYEEDGSPERCNECGGYINSHGHCTKCDY